jgi:hypothetical protein
MYNLFHGILFILILTIAVLILNVTAEMLWTVSIRSWLICKDPLEITFMCLEISLIHTIGIYILG